MQKSCAIFANLNAQQGDSMSEFVFPIDSPYSRDDNVLLCLILRKITRLLGSHPYRRGGQFKPYEPLLPASHVVLFLGHWTRFNLVGGGSECLPTAAPARAAVSPGIGNPKPPPPPPPPGAHPCHVDGGRLSCTTDPSLPPRLNQHENGSKYLVEGGQ